MEIQFCIVCKFSASRSYRNRRLFNCTENLQRALIHCLAESHLQPYLLTNINSNNTRDRLVEKTVLKHRGNTGPLPFSVAFSLSTRLNHFNPRTSNRPAFQQIFGTCLVHSYIDQATTVSAV